MRKYPIGLQNFKEIRSGGYQYIDKTPVIYQVIESGKYFFLSRPRRFGKSLLLSTIKEIFNGNKELFKGLWIENNWNWDKKHPVIHFCFSRIAYQYDGLEKAIDNELDRQAGLFGISLTTNNIKSKFEELIHKVSAEEKVVILIDEYDKPIIDYLDNLEKVNENRTVFKIFYSVLKDADQYIKLLFITGVSRFSKVSIFSDLNNLRDITLSSDFATIAGITQQELETDFAEEINKLKVADPNIFENIRKWYNGYTWNGVDKVYNPFSLLNFMADRSFRNYWFATGTPTFLVKLLKNKGEYDFEETQSNENTLGNFHIENTCFDSPFISDGISYYQKL